MLKTIVILIMERILVNMSSVEILKAFPRVDSWSGLPVCRPAAI